LIKDIESHLTKLAIETIFEDKRIVDVLWPHLPHQSNEDVAAEEKEIAMNGLSFGLIIKNRENNINAQFVHRTYAEYLFARYLYKGFLLDDERHNKLLDDTTASKLIVNKILSKREYNGVQVFFNGMLKELVDGNEKWRNNIDTRDLPERLKKFTEHICIQILHKNFLVFENVISISLSNGFTMIFTFLCDCLDATFEKKLIQTVMLKCSKYFSFEYFYKVESQSFKRFMDYLDSAVKRDLSTVISTLHYSFRHSKLSGEEQRKIIHHLLQFMKKHIDDSEKDFNSYRMIKSQFEPMLNYCIFSEDYDGCNLKILLKYLSRLMDHSNDFHFAELLKEAFGSQKRFIGGRIEKALAVLCDLKRKNLLILMQCTILTIEPKAFHVIYKPIEEEGEIPADLHFLLERDSYRMTRLHRAAFYGNTEAVEEMLKKIHQNFADPEQKEVANQVINEVMVQDEHGLTPFYVAAACGHKEIYHKMLAFLKQVLPDDTLEKHLKDKEGFVHRSLSDAIYSENIQMFQLILIAVRKVLGQHELLRILQRSKFFFAPGSQHSLGLNVSLNTFSHYSTHLSTFKGQTEEIVNAMAMIVVMRDDSAMDYRDLYVDLLFQDGLKKDVLHYFDAKNLQGILLHRGVQDFVDKLLDNTNVHYSLEYGFRMITYGHLLRKFTKDQLEQFVETITSKKDSKKIESSANLRKHWLVPRNSYWSDLIEFEAKHPFAYNEGLVLSMVLDIFNSEKCVSESLMKKLLLHEDNGFVVIHLSPEAIKFMLTYLSKDGQEEVKRQWRNNSFSLDTVFPLTIKLHPLYSGERDIFVSHSSNILCFYLYYGSDVHLRKEFINTVTSLRDMGEEQRSVWSYIFEHCHREERAKEILKLVSEKTDILGRDAVKTMLFHKFDEIPLLFKAMLWGRDIDAQLEILPKEIKEDIQQFLKTSAPGFIDQAFRNPQTHFKRWNSDQHYNRLNTLISFLNYSNDNQLQQFVQNITSFNLIIPIRITIIGHSASIEQERAYSIWVELFTHLFEDYQTDDIANMDKFMKLVLEKLGPNAVKELVLHSDGEMEVILNIARRGEEKMLETMLKYLAAKDRKKIEKFLDKTFEISPDGNLINNYPYSFY
jgi:hypothetical protein